ncbi:MAG: peptide-methionine (R)-S-oxide reductase MsrB [Actinomycetota bacterium]
MSSAINKTEQQWREELTPQQYHVLREKGTERAFTGEYVDVADDGTYHCAGCGSELFSAETQFDHGCGWPSFTEPADRKGVELTPDHSLGMIRTEVTCATCGGHLGHVFPDGPGPTGDRYCINSAALKVRKAPKE